MIAIGAFVRVTQDALSDEPLVVGMVGKVVPDVYGKADLADQALVVFAGSRKPCRVPLEAVVEISESDYGDETESSRQLWRQRRELWRKRHGSLPRLDPPKSYQRFEVSTRSSKNGAGLDVAEIVKRAEAVEQSEMSAIASPALISILTEWSVGAIDVLADELPSFGKMSYSRARKVRTEHIERWLWDGLRVYLSVRSFSPLLPPITAEPARDRVRALFDRIDEGEAAKRLATFSIDVPSVKSALKLMATHWLNEAVATFAKGLEKNQKAYQGLAQHILQLHIVGFQAAFCADQANHGTPTH